MSGTVLTDGQLPATCRVLVVGGGLAGLETAKELERRGVTDVVVLEAGPAEDLRHVNSANSADTALRMWLQPESDASFRRPWAAQTPPHYTGSSGLRQRLGGRSLYWYGVTLPIEPWALTEPWWPSGVVSDLSVSWCGGEPLYQRVQTQLETWRRADSTLPPLVDETLSGQVAGFDLLATPAAIRRNSVDPDRWLAYSPLDAWREPDTGRVLRKPDGIRILSDSEVLHVTVRDGRCRGVLVRNRATGETREIAAPFVVLAAGTLENSRLSVQLLAEGGRLPARRLTGLSDHIVQGFFLPLDRSRAERILARIAPGNYYAPCAVRSNLFFEVLELPDGGALVDVRTTGEQLPSEDCYVECETDSDYPWSYRARAMPSEADLEVVEAQRGVLQQVWDDVALIAGCSRSTLEFGDFNNPGRTNAFVLPESIGAQAAGMALTWSSFLGVEDHEGGTLPVGRILAENLEFEGIRGVFAVGPGVFPRLGAANPSLTTLALAHRLAAELTDRC
ncbi:FAD-dependent oxidoreductase [Kitasatospora aureofaciens]|uniref:FAD-dependent oxidoreductase n=1 Tax=Kitasatospora aureofaciens TaxID=1894 RepID=UPI0037C72C89